MEAAQYSVKQTESKILWGSALHLEDHVPKNSVDLVITSPPYPMIQMWDETFDFKPMENMSDAKDNFEKAHRTLDVAWGEIYNTLKPGGIACINIGDATRSIEKQFNLFSNHSRVIRRLMDLGFTILPDILWRKPNNSPTKFMGSGMYPVGAYVTYEHEYILIARKEPKREFSKSDEVWRRKNSAFFWEERNKWFSDIWTDLKGAKQYPKGKETSKHVASFPFELAYRLVNMFSIKGDTVLDPFAGTGTTVAAAMASQRNSIGIDKDTDFFPVMRNIPDWIIPHTKKQNRSRLYNHVKFVEQQKEKGKNLKYRNLHYGFPVMSLQEENITFSDIEAIHRTEEGNFLTEYQISLKDREIQKEYVNIISSPKGLHDPLEDE